MLPPPAARLFLCLFTSSTNYSEFLPVWIVAVCVVSFVSFILYLQHISLVIPPRSCCVSIHETRRNRWLPRRICVYVRRADWRVFCWEIQETRRDCRSKTIRKLWSRRILFVKGSRRRKFYRFFSRVFYDRLTNCWCVLRRDMYTESLKEN